MISIYAERVEIVNFSIIDSITVTQLTCYQTDKPERTCNVTEVQGEAQRTGDLGDEPVAGSEAESDRGLG